MKITVPVRIEAPDGATHYIGHLLDHETPYSVSYLKRIQEAGYWVIYWEGVWKPVGVVPEGLIKPLPLHEPPMAVEVCIHGNVITNKLGIACPEGCLSNAQRGRENRELAGALGVSQARVQVLEAQISILEGRAEESIWGPIDREVFDTFTCEQLRDEIMDPNSHPMAEED